MNVLAFELCPDNRRGGQERSLFEVLHGLSRQGAKISLVFQDHGNLESDYRAFSQILVRVPCAFNFSLRSTASFVYTLARLTLFQIRQRWDVLYVNQYIDIALPVLLGKLIARPVVAHLRLPPPTSGFSRQYRWGLNQCAKLVAISQSTAEAHRLAGITAPIEVVYNGTDLSHFAPGADAVTEAGVVRVLYLGRVLPDKGVHTLVDACEIAAETMPVRLTVVGNSWPSEEGRAYYQRLQQKLAKGRCQGQFGEHVEDVRSLLAQADLLVLPSIWQEPFGRVLIEAMASGVPVIASRVGGIPEVLAPDFESHLVPPDDPQALADAILQHGAWRSADPDLGLRMRRHVDQNFDSRATHARILRILHDCC